MAVTFTTVKKDDTLSEIVARHNQLTGDHLTIARVVRENGISNPDRIQKGKVIFFFDMPIDAIAATKGSGIWKMPAINPSSADKAKSVLSKYLGKFIDPEQRLGSEGPMKSMHYRVTRFGFKEESSGRPSLYLELADSVNRIYRVNIDGSLTELSSYDFKIVWNED